MASTRNKNTPEDYVLEQTSIFNQFAYTSYDQSNYFAHPPQTHFAGNGLVGMKTPHRNLASNYCDIETQLLGIGSTNLVTPYVPVEPQINQTQSLNVADRLPLQIPSPFQHENYHRYMYLS
jgi:hypothetical protein